MDILRPLVKEKPVVIFSRSSSDPVSHTMTQLFTRYGANPTVHELNEMANRREIEGALQNMMGPNLGLPVVFIGGNFVGGANDVIGHQVRGELVKMLMSAGAIWVWNRN